MVIEVSSLSLADGTAPTNCTISNVELLITILQIFVTTWNVYNHNFVYEPTVTKVLMRSLLY